MAKTPGDVHEADGSIWGPDMRSRTTRGVVCIRRNQLDAALKAGWTSAGPAGAPGYVLVERK